MDKLTREQIDSPTFRLLIKTTLGSDELCDLALSALEREGWIPVSERLPESYGFYLIAIAHHGHVVSSHFEHDPVSGKGRWQYSGVTHWRPLPAAPKG